MAIVEASAIIGTIRSASDILDRIRRSTSLDEARNASAALADALAKTQISILDLVQEIAAVQDENRGLKADIEKARNFDLQREKFSYCETPGGGAVYRRKNAAGGVDGSAAFCQNCMDNAQKIVVLQPGATIPGLFKCSNCGAAHKI